MAKITKNYFYLNYLYAIDVVLFFQIVFLSCLKKQLGKIIKTDKTCL